MEDSKENIEISLDRYACCLNYLYEEDLKSELRSGAYPILNKAGIEKYLDMQWHASVADLHHEVGRLLFSIHFGSLKDKLDTLEDRASDLLDEEDEEEERSKREG
jgi:hypothetical protein